MERQLLSDSERMPSRIIGLEFGEQIHFRRTRTHSKMVKLDSLWSDGVLAGPLGNCIQKLMKRRLSYPIWTTVEIAMDRPKYQERDYVPRRVMITASVVGRFGPSPGCMGCHFLSVGGNRHPHTEACRSRLVTLMSSDTECAKKVQASRNRINDSGDRRQATPDGRSVANRGHGHSANQQEINDSTRERRGCWHEAATSRRRWGEQQ